MPFLDNDGVTRLTTDYLDVFARKEDAILDPSGGLIRTDDGISVDSLTRESDGAISGSIAELTAEGHAEQVSTTGKNIAVSLTSSATYDGIVVTPKSDGSVTLSGTSTKDSNKVIITDYVQVLKGETYTVSIGEDSGLEYGLSGYGKIHQITPTADFLSMGIIVYVDSGVTVNATFYPQLELGSEATEYEPYTGGAPSPSPDYPQEIQVVRGRNLLDVEGYLTSRNASYTRNGNTYEITTFGDTYTQPLVFSDSPIQATVSGKVTDVTSSNARVDVGRYVNGEFTILANLKDDTNNVSGAYNALRLNRSVGGVFRLSDFQITLGSTPQPYVPYGHVEMEVRDANDQLLSTTPIPLPQRGWVAGLPDGTADSLRLDGAGKCEWTLPTKIQVFDGSSDEGWAGYSTGTSGKYRLNSVLIQSVARKTPTGTVAPIVCDMFAAKTLSNVYSCIQGISLDGSEAVVSLYADSYQSASSWRTYLASNNMTLLYPLATPVTEDCGYVEDWPTDIPEGATITIPELDALNVKYFVDDSAGALGKQWYERAVSESDASIDQRIELVESNVATIESTTAQSNHAVNSYFMLDNVLRKATAAIASGETISNSNSSPITVEQVVTALNNSVAALEKEVVFATTPSVSHRNIYRGKNLGTALTTAQKAQIAAGTFDDLYVGDYWTINGRVYRIADINYYYNSGDASFTKNHLVIVPDASFGSDKMNDTNDTTGAYKGSKMYTDSSSVLNTARATIANDFGSALATHRIYLQNATTNGYASAGEWTDSTVDLMNEPMVYGSYIFTPTGDGSKVVNSYTVEKSQLALFRLNHQMINPGRYWYWLRDVVSGTSFARVGGNGSADYVRTSDSSGVRPDFCIVGD